MRWRSSQLANGCCFSCFSASLNRRSSGTSSWASGGASDSSVASDASLWPSDVAWSLGSLLAPAPLLSSRRLPEERRAAFFGRCTAAAALLGCARLFVGAPTEADVTALVGSPLAEERFKLLLAAGVFSCASARAALARLGGWATVMAAAAAVAWATGAAGPAPLGGVARSGRLTGGGSAGASSVCVGFRGERRGVLVATVESRLRLELRLLRG
jgi:hypothetical protein